MSEICFVVVVVVWGYQEKREAISNVRNKSRVPHGSLVAQLCSTLITNCCSVWLGLNKKQEKCGVASLGQSNNSTNREKEQFLLYEFKSYRRRPGEKETTFNNNTHTYKKKGKLFL